MFVYKIAYKAVLLRVNSQDVQTTKMFAREWYVYGFKECWGR